MDARTTPAPMTSLSHKEARVIVIGMMLPVFMGSLDNTNLATALPTIGRDLGDSHSLPWLITAYLLAATAVVPLYGKIADIYGRKFTLRIAIVIYIMGSLVCALAPNMLVLILGRALHGLGGGGLSAMGAIVLGDVVAPKERGRYYAYFAVVYTSAGALGPALGGFFSDHLHWSAIFWFNILLGFTALAVTSVLLRRLPRHERPHKLDLIGAVLIVIASVSFMLAINLGGVRYPWTSPPILALFALAAAVGLMFVRRLTTAPEPLIPIAILRNRNVRFATGAHAFGWSSIVGLNIFMPQYLQNVIGLTPTSAGLTLVIFMIALNVSAGAAGHVVGRVVHYKALPMAGLAVSISALLVLAWNVEQRQPALVRNPAGGDRARLRRDDEHHASGGAEFGRASPARHFGRHHDVLPQPAGDADGRGVRRHRLGLCDPGRRAGRARRRAGAGCGTGGGSLSARVLRDRRDPDGGADLDLPRSRRSRCSRAKRSKPWIRRPPR